MSQEVTKRKLGHKEFIIIALLSQGLHFSLSNISETHMVLGELPLPDGGSWYSIHSVSDHTEHMRNDEQMDFFIGDFSPSQEERTTRQRGCTSLHVEGSNYSASGCR